MKQIQFKDIVGFAPYGLKMIFEKSGRVITLTGLIKCETKGRFIFVGDTVDEYPNWIWNFKPVLHPMSDFFSSQKFQEELIDNHIEDSACLTIIDNEIHYFYRNEFVFFDIINDVQNCPLFIIEFLYRYHFDIHGWIEQGLAVDINTLE